MKTLVTFLILLLGLQASTAFAIVNMEDVHLNDKGLGHSGKLSLDVNGAAGNSEFFVVDVGARWQFKNVKSMRFIQMKYSYGEAFAVENTNQAFVHFRNIQDLTSVTSWEFFVQAEQNQFSRLVFRGLLGAGLRWNIFPDSANNRLFLGAGAFHSLESIESSPVAEDSGKEQIARANFYALYTGKLTQNLTIQSSTYFQPALNDVADFRLLEVFGFSFLVNKSLSANLMLEISHDNEPPQLIEKTDINYKTGVSYRF